MLVYLVLAAMACIACGSSDLDVRSEPSANGWKKINVKDACFEAKGNRYATVMNFGPGKLVGAIKLVHKSGYVRCVSNTAYNSRWGCAHYSSFVRNPLNVIITDSHDRIVFPKQEYITHAAGKWYWMPFVSDQHSNELVFTDFCKPFYYPAYAELRIWYGEDLTDWSEHDNQGRVCVDVFAKFVA